MSYRIEKQKRETYPENPSLESVRRNPGGSTVKRWRKVKRNRTIITYPSRESAIEAVSYQVPGETGARVVDHETGEVVWTR